MIKLYLTLFILSTLYSSPGVMASEKENKALEFPLASGFELGAFDHTPLCQSRAVFAELGYQLAPFHIPVPRILTEAVKGRVPVATIYGLSDLSQEVLQYLELVEPPLTQVTISVYGRANSGKTVESYQDLLNYRTGAMRVHSSGSRKMKGFQLFNSMDSAYKSLLSDRIDWVVDSDFGFSFLEPRFPKGSIIKEMTVGTYDIHLAFSHAYFGKEQAKILAEDYQQLMLSLIKEVGSTCP